MSKSRNQDRNPQAVHRSVTVQTYSYQGPLPPAEQIAAYEAIHSGLADRTFKVFENQSQHRMTMERRALSGEQISSILGTLCGLVLCLAILALAAYLAKLGHPGWAMGVTVVDLGAVAGAFLHGTWQRKRERIAKAEIMMQSLPRT